MIKSVLKVAEQIDNSYKLTREEYEKICTEFYEAQSLTRMLREISHPDTKEESFDDLDIYNVCSVLMDKFKTIEPLLGK